MAHTDRYETVITLNTEQAKKEIDVLETKITGLRKKQEGYAPDSKQYKNLQKEIDKYNAKLNTMRNRMDSVNDALRNMSTAKPKQLKDTIKDINALLNSKDIKRGSDEWKRLTSALKEANTQLTNIKNEAKVSQPIFGRFFKFLNDSWGGLTIAFQSITGISQSIRKTVQDFADMEEAMADTRKYTGLTDDAVRDLNDDLKKMNTRTSREELNALAGAAGRLGKTSKKDILDFVEAGNMIKVALGDDLGEGAIDNVGKLAMAFGEDETMGLRGAMLATGSAINELAQNSSAQAGYLVDFTARVAGFGKQLGLTQAQIMGFGAVMDENLLRDEMAATAFGNMLTKMQTDTAKFAKIAGMDFEKFSKLLKEDANGAILALADNLKRADPQTMMKMLDDMGLDGSRAVGVLSTLADKIDDVRARQELATKAYEEGTSVQKEYSVMNNTVQAEIDKAKKRFHEMSIELGERLVPVVKYTLSTTSLLTKGLSAFTKFVFDNIGAITKLTVVLLEYVAVQKIHWLWTKRHIVVETASIALRKANAAATAATVFAEKALTVAKMAQNGVISKTVALQWLLNKAWKASPIGWVTTGVVLLTAACVKLYNAMSNTNKQQKIGSELAETAIERAAEEKAKISELVRTARNQNEQLDKRKKAVEELNAIIPGYNGQLDETTGKYNENSEALRTYNNLLLEKYRLEAAEEKIKEIERNKFKEELEYEETMRRLHKENTGGSSFISRWVATQGRQAEGSNSNKGYQQQVTRDHEKKMAQYQEELSIVQGIRDNTKEIVDFNRTLTQTMEDQRKVLEGGKPENNTPQNPGSPTYTPSSKKGDGKTDDPEKERIKKLREQAREEKAVTDGLLADNMLAYSAGLKDYRQFTEDQLEIRREGLKALMKVWETEPAEYAKIQKQLAALILNGDDELNRLRSSDFESAHMILMQQLERDFNTEGSAIYHNERAYNEARFQEEMAYLEDRKELTREGSLERMQVEWEIEDRMRQHQLENERTFQEQLMTYREEYSLQGVELREKVELDGLKRMYEELKKTGAMNEEEYQKLLERIRAKYAKERADGAEGFANSTRQTTQKAKQENRIREIMAIAENEAIKIRDAEEGKSPTVFQAIFGDISQYASQFSILKKMYADNKISYDEMMQGMLDTSAMLAGAIGEKLKLAMDAVTPLMDAMSSYYSAQSDYEVALVEKRYEKQIAAAGKNQERQKKLEEKKEKEIAAIKTKYNRKQVKMQIAQALAQTAISALNAYASVWAGAPWPANTILAPIAAGIATAAGMLQVAAIKKQAAAQEAGYYEGGFTGGKRYHREAGVVHEGEFVANHQAVNNPNVLPFLNFLDQAQRNNTIGSLSKEDISRQLGNGGTMVTPVINVNTDNEGMRQSAEELSDAASGLKEKLSEPIPCYVVLDGPDGLIAQIKHIEKLKGI